MMKNMTRNSEKGWHKSSSLPDSFHYAGRGIIWAVMHERNSRIILSIFLGVLLAAFLLRLPALEIAILILTGAMVIALEFVNSSLEALEDIVWPEYRLAVRRSKDLAAGAVFIMSGAAASIGILVLGPRLLGMLVG